MLSYADLKEKTEKSTSVLNNHEQNNWIFVIFINFPLKCGLSPAMVAFIWPVKANSFIIASWNYRKQTYLHGRQ